MYVLFQICIFRCMDLMTRFASPTECWKGRFDMTPWFQKLVSRINFGFNFPPQGVPIWRSITTPRQRSQPKNLVSYMRKHFKSLQKVRDTWFQIRRICWRKNVLQMTLFSPMMVSELISCFHEFCNYKFTNFFFTKFYFFTFLCGKIFWLGSN